MSHKIETRRYFVIHYTLFVMQDARITQYQIVL